MFQIIVIEEDRSNLMGLGGLEEEQVVEGEVDTEA